MKFRVAASLATLFVVALGYGMLASVAPALVAGLMRATDPQLALHTGALTAAYLLAFAFGAPWWGGLSDRSAGSWIAASGMGAFAVAFALIAQATDMAVLYAGVLAAGLGASAVTPAIQRQAADLADEVLQARFLAALGAASFAGWFTGPLVAVRSPGATKALWGIAILGLVAAAGCLFVFHDAAHRKRREWSGSFEHAKVNRVVVLAALVAFGVGAFEISLMLSLERVIGADRGTIARALLECTIVMMIVQVAMFAVPAVRPRWSACGAAILFFIMAASSASNGAWPAALVAYATVVPFAASATVLQSMISIATVKSGRASAGRSIGWQLAASSAGQGLGGLAASLSFAPSGRGFYFGAAIMLCAAIVAWVGRSRNRHSPLAQPVDPNKSTD